MTDKELQEIIFDLQYVPEDRRDKAMNIVLKAASDSFDLKAAKKLLSERHIKPQYEKGGSIKFTNKEIEKMPGYVRKLFAYDDMIINYRITNGYFQARYRRNGYNITVTARDFDTMKKKFIAKLDAAVHDREIKEEQSKYPLLKDYMAEWLDEKEKIRKPLTMVDYRNKTKLYINDSIGQKHVNEITRQDVQSMLDEMQDRGLRNSAGQVKMILTSVFKRIEFDFKIESPMKYIELAEYEKKRGKAFTKSEEKTIVEFCESNPKYRKVNSAILLLLYTGMRVGELESATRDDTYIYCVSEKTRRGRSDVVRSIPISPMLKRVLHLIDFDDAITVARCSVLQTLKRIFPDRHTHELRYTFITRAKECGINPEVVMLWDGHAVDKDCKSSKVDRGYTDYSEEYLLSEIKKYDYEL